MRYVAQEVGWARKGAGGEDGADPGAVGWLSFRHHTARPTLHIQDGAREARITVSFTARSSAHCFARYWLMRKWLTLNHHASMWVRLL
jgi:hypothetical protein